MGGLGQERKNVMYNYVTEEHVSRCKSLFQSILDRLRKKLKREYGTKVRIVLVGSGASNTPAQLHDPVHCADPPHVGIGEKYPRHSAENLIPHPPMYSRSIQPSNKKEYLRILGGRSIASFFNLCSSSSFVPAYPGRLDATHNPPQPTLELGYASSPRSARAPARR